MSAATHVPVTADELKLLQIIRAADPDADFEVHRRGGRIVNVTETTIHRQKFSPAPLREPAVPPR